MKIKTILISLLLIQLSNTSYSQAANNDTISKNYVSREQHITNIRNEYIMNQVNLFFTLKGDSIIQYMDRKRNEVFMTGKVGSIKIKGSTKIKYEIDNYCEGCSISLKEVGIDTFTNKSYQVIYELKEQ